MLLRLAALLSPPACAACGAPPERASDLLCAACRGALPWLRDPCPRCALAAPCGRRCPARAAAWQRAWCPLEHRGPARALVVALKHRGALAAADAMAAQLAANAPPGLLEGVALVPVPVPALRRRARGHDHARRLAAALSRRTGLVVVPCLRAVAAGRQVGLGAAARRRRARDAVAAHGPAPVAAVLVDDVMTTGATLDACARALRGAGARRVDAIAYARAPRRG